MPFGHTHPEDSSSNHPSRFSLYVLFPLPGPPSLFLMVNSSSLRSSSEATSSRQASFLGRTGQPVPCGEPHEGEDLFLDIFVYQLPTQGLALSRAQEMSNTPNASPFLPLGRSVLLDSCLVAQAGEHPSGVGRTQPQEAAHQVWSHTRPGTQLPLKPGWASAEGAGALSTLFTGGVSAGKVPTGPGSRVVGTESLAYAGGQWYQEGPGVTGPWVGSSWTWTPKSSHGCVTLDKSPPHSGTQWPPL